MEQQSCNGAEGKGLQWWWRIWSSRLQPRWQIWSGVEGNRIHGTKEKFVKVSEIYRAEEGFDGSSLEREKNTSEQEEKGIERKRA
ncbi:hypothetical protein L6164_001197 [Bauhinia variegata]|uniref:Uncharacterized protein n=1 Tax=Bauhinia variegata TaxID=167791 RepID=A0ACB9Q8Q4_BAUVA|nr:hypothetical protein L6164_001197 [Bauhinia variegata]